MEPAHRPAGRQLWPAQTESSKSEPHTWIILSSIALKKHQVLSLSDLLLVKVDRAQTEEDKVSVWRLLPKVQAPFVAQLCFVECRLHIVTVTIQRPNISTILNILFQRRIKIVNILVTILQTSDSSEVVMCDTLQTED